MKTIWLIAIVICLSAGPASADGTPAHKHHHKRYAAHHVPHWTVPPGYRTPAQIAREQRRHAWEHGHFYYYGPAWPGFYRGRWNGGGFGPCYTQTPIGPMWNCGS